MSLKLYYHPLASFCWKALIALYENGTPFEPIIVDLADASSRESFRQGLADRQVSGDPRRGAQQTIAEATIVIEYLDAFYPGATRFVPADPDRAWQARMWDRVFDHYIHEPMQKIVIDRIRPEGKAMPMASSRQRASSARHTRCLTGRSARRSGRWATTSPLSTAPLPLPSPMRRR